MPKANWKKLDIDVDYNNHRQPRRGNKSRKQGIKNNSFYKIPSKIKLI